MRTFVQHTIVVAVLLFTALAQAQPQRPRTQGPVTILGEVDAGTSILPAPVVGGLVYDGISQAVLYSDGGTWAPITSAAASPVAMGNYMYAKIAVTQTTNMVAGDHVKFDTVTASNGSVISLDTTTTYASGNNVASIGRFTLNSGHTYYLSAIVADIIFNTAASDVRLAWVNADNGAIINPAGYSIPFNSGGGGTNEYTNADVQAIFTPSVNTRVEVRIPVAPAGTVNQLGETGTGFTAAPSAIIFTLN